MSNSSNKSVTLKEVAEAAGVSVSTASRALSGKAEACRISSATEQSVREAAKKLQFSPSLLARSLRSQQTKLLGVVLPNVANPFFAAIAREITLAAEADGYSVLLTDSQENGETEARLVEQLQARQIEGLVVCPVGMDETHLCKLANQKLPLVLVDRGFDNRDLVTVTSDHQSGARIAMNELLDAGHRTIGILQGLPETLPNRERLSGVQDSLSAAGLDFDPMLIAGHHFDEASGYQAALRLLTTRPEITALFAFSNQNALGALRAAAEMGRAIPDDLSLIAFDDFPFAAYLAAPLTSVSQDVSQLGQVAAQLLLEQIRSSVPPEQKQYRIPVQLMRRSSIKNIG
ncbi:LacI family DNA-binding transcriptional regulator [Gimesia sp.]|uniref:LacI family DNA-binding transcriptional regulator n=1 Tax=Gimesia sp. TaxID=2024833 RepID=UPI000C52E307|nr:LacI family DNA-binding transcriptional regulator [Gimesia sp.]MAX40295.1 LacI family transcriptional regulator [Gimesia sp.]